MRPNRNVSHEDIFRALLLREELEYHLQTDNPNAPYTAHGKSRFDTPESCCVFGDNVRRMKMLQAVNAAFERQGFEEDVCLIPESACEGFFVKKQPSYYMFTPTFTSADLHLHTFTSADLHLHTFTPADLHLHTFTPADLDLHTLASADLHLGTLTPADLHLHTLTSADLHLHTFTSADLLSLFFLFSLKAGAVPPERHETQPFRTKWTLDVQNLRKIAILKRRAQPFRTKWTLDVQNLRKIAILKRRAQPFRTKWTLDVQNLGKIAIFLSQSQPFRTEWTLDVKN